ncbi:cysteine-rich venom protein Mr30 [Aplysia californica]|uniref:Cysteine-rich venom protein Mr30 n=1 Tax=Aplysia californica TaxID=6500 RepID=A0ABM0JV45_APLCA|nr:cysteine-rich venom protein Mr30 [Aplysia californica]
MSSEHPVVPPAPVTTSRSPVFVSPYNCTYRGQRASPGECRTFGDRGMDRWLCASNGGRFKCRMCQSSGPDLCPVMCGLCDAPCKGKKCLNGELDPDTCKCACTKHYTGDTCDEMDCPDKDKWSCVYYKKVYCRIFPSIPVKCPYLCGICTKHKMSP